MSMKQTLVLNAGETRGDGPLNILGDKVWIKLSGNDTAGGYAVIECASKPQSGPPLHRHDREDEYFYVIEGEYLFEVDGKQIHAGPGSSVFAAIGTAHTFQNVGTEVGRLLVMAQPAGLESFFSDLADATGGGGAPDMSVIVPVFHKHGLEVLGPPLAMRTTQSKVGDEVASVV